MQALSAERQARTIARATFRMTLETPLTTHSQSSHFHITNCNKKHSQKTYLVSQAARAAVCRILIVINAAINMTKIVKLVKFTKLSIFDQQLRKADFYDNFQR